MRTHPRRALWLRCRRDVGLIELAQPPEARVVELGALIDVDARRLRRRGAETVAGAAGFRAAKRRAASGRAAGRVHARRKIEAQARQGLLHGVEDAFRGGLAQEAAACDLGHGEEEVDVVVDLVEAAVPLAVRRVVVLPHEACTGSAARSLLR
jgi:hypothetical protein